MGARADRRAERIVKLIRNLAFVRVALVPLAVTKILLDRDDFPSQGYERAAWAVVGGLRRGRPAARLAVVSLARAPALPRGAERRHGLRDHDGPDVRVRVGAGPAPAVAPAPGRAGGGALLPPRRRVDRRRGHVPDPARARSLAGGAVRRSRPVRRARAPGRRRHVARRGRRSARRHGARPGARRRGAGRGSGAPPRRARPPGRPARGDQPRSARARLVARPRAGVCRVRARVAQPAAVRPRGDPARRGRRRPRDGDRGHRRPGLSGAGHGDHGAGRDPRGGDRGRADDLPRGHRRGPLSGGGRAARARRPRPGARAAAARNALDRRSRDRTHRARVLPGGGDRPGDAPRAARRDGGAEPAHLRGRARDGRRAAAAFGAPRRLRLARLARAPQPDGGGDRLGPHAAGALARAEARSSARRSSP